MHATDKFINHSNLLKKEILYCVAEGSYSNVYFTNGKRTILSSRLGCLEILLKEKSFFRIHRKHLVNLNQVKAAEFRKEAKLVLRDNTVLPVARRRKTIVKALLRELCIPCMSN